MNDETDRNCHGYGTANLTQIVRELERLLGVRKTEMGRLIHAFEEEYTAVELARTNEL